MPQHAATTAGLAGVVRAAGAAAPETLAWHGLQGLVPGEQRLAWAAQQLALARTRDEIVAALGEARVPVLVLKGAALGQYLYASPLQRSCSDLDLLVPAGTVADAEAVLRGQGFRAPASFAGPALLPARVHVRRLGAWALPVDLHWALLSDPLFRDAFPFARLWAARRRLPAGGFGLGPVHALLHAVLHRGLLPRRSRGRVIWLLDVHLLWIRLTAGQRARACAVAEEAGAAALLAHALGEAAGRFGTRVDDGLLRRLRAVGAASPGARMLASEGRASRLALRLAALPGLRARLAYLRELLLPPGPYMEARFGSRRRSAYLRRGLRGLRGLFRPEA